MIFEKKGIEILLELGERLGDWRLSLASTAHYGWRRRRALLRRGHSFLLFSFGRGRRGVIGITHSLATSGLGGWGGCLLALGDYGRGPWR